MVLQSKQLYNGNRQLYQAFEQHGYTEQWRQKEVVKFFFKSFYFF